MNFFRNYLISKRRTIGVFLLFALVLFSSFLLYRLPLASVLYPLLLCLLIGALFLTADFLRTKKTHNELLCLQKLSADLIDTLPDAETVTDADYQALIQLLREQEKASRALSSEKYEQMVNYYTLWAHQIKTPISSMRLNLQNEDSPLSRTLRSDLHNIEQYVDMVLTYLRLDASATDYLIREYDLDGIVRGAVRKFAGEFISRKLRLDYNAPSIRVLTDEKWLSFVIEQVLSNALKYTVDGGISIYMEPGKTLCIRDTGMGITPEDLPRIFEQGFTGFNGRADMKASGIGLYLCRRVCQNLGHTISAESETGRGTVIRIALDTRPLEVE